MDEILYEVGGVQVRQSDLLADVLAVLEGELAALGLHEPAFRPLGGDLAQDRGVERAGGRLALAGRPEVALHDQVDDVLAAHRVAGAQRELEGERETLSDIR